MFGLLTYNLPHLKSQSIALSCAGYIDYIFTIPFVSRKPRNVVFEHRPTQFVGLSPMELASTIEAECLTFDDLQNNNFRNLRHLIVGGCGLLPKKVTDRYSIINSHPGLIPTSRGLDSFKWSIFNQWPLGITIHQINQDVDLGKLIHHSPTPLFKDDSLQVLAARHYNNEISTLCSFIKSELSYRIISGLNQNPAMKRMHKSLEANLPSKLVEYKLQYCI